MSVLFWMVLLPDLLEMEMIKQDCGSILEKNLHASGPTVHVQAVAWNHHVPQVVSFSGLCIGRSIIFYISLVVRGMKRHSCRIYCCVHKSATLSGITWYNLSSVEIGLMTSGSLY
ncbi:uncharacterized protein LOC130791070 [Actinidia eriantha]|uniref:uncharacterized protein LOC130791070 n=1 Tax=Actinidia eriantha TaxID=165200 RepID=UPI0025895066|nr:uncharacterized protein LOC130791070 [Actinidia eriantha]